MKPLSDHVIARLKAGMHEPDLQGTRYRIVRYLARGGMGSVWLTEDTILHRHVALKVLDLAIPSDDLAARLLQEAHILAALEHPGIVPVHDAGTLPDGRAFYCMKYVEGHTLTARLASLTLPEKIRLLERIAEPVEFAHSRGYIHRDLKPENVMIGAFGEVLVMDWGLAKIAALPTRATDNGLVNAASHTGTLDGSILGTPGYMSPEQARGDTVIDHRADIFSLGAILSFMLGPSAPRPLRAICEKAMAADPNLRYQNARDMTTDLAHYLEGAPISAYREGLLERAGRIYRRNQTAVILVAVYLLMRLLFILFARR